MGSYDPTCRRASGVFRKAGHTPDGPVVLELRREKGGLVARAYGPGACWALARADALAGLRDDPSGFTPPPGRLATLARRGRGIHLPRSPFVFDALTTAILQQRIAWRDAARAHRLLVAAFSDDAPGPLGLKLPLTPRQWLRVPDASFRRAGVDGQRARALRAAARQARAVDAAFELGFAEARAVLARVPGCGPWTVAMALGFGLGDPDAAITGDLHLPRLVAWALAGESEADDARMLELLEPFRPHRFRLVRLLYAAGVFPSLSSRSRAARTGDRYSSQPGR